MRFGKGITLLATFLLLCSSAALAQVYTIKNPAKETKRYCKARLKISRLLNSKQQAIVDKEFFCNSAIANQTPCARQDVRLTKFTQQIEKLVEGKPAYVDLEADGVLDDQDIAGMSACLGQETVPGDSCYRYDFNQNLVVDEIDTGIFEDFRRCYDLSVVPE
ncbi:MAG: hypothetical protein KDD42_01555 [Bdellovibrionales bacterium]|nr:hypothetical protein [Bdellovibrionales bacterium]